MATAAIRPDLPGQAPLPLPFGYSRIQRVNSFHALATTPFAQGVNALCWERPLPGDFGEVVAQLDAGDGITDLSATRLQQLAVSAAGLAAIDFMLEDERLLRTHGLSPVLNCIRSYPREDIPGPVPIDVYSFHVDSATVPADTWLCTYHGPASEGLRNDHAQRRVDIPATRTQLRQEFGDGDDAEFNEYLKENCFDLHYAPLAEASPFSFGLGHLWRIAVEYPGCPVPPCIHRAPENLPGQPPRLLLIS